MRGRRQARTDGLEPRGYLTFTPLHCDCTVRHFGAGRRGWEMEGGLVLDRNTPAAEQGDVGSVRSNVVAFV